MSRTQFKSSSSLQRGQMAFKKSAPSNHSHSQKNSYHPRFLEGKESNFVEIGRKGGEARAQQLGHEGYEKGQKSTSSVLKFLREGLFLLKNKKEEK